MNVQDMALFRCVVGTFCMSVVLGHIPVNNGQGNSIRSCDLHVQSNDVNDVHMFEGFERQEEGESCIRKCREGAPPKTCYYKFVLEHYATMGSACVDCPRNTSSCSLPQCVTADGYERGVLTTNRKIPGPSIQVCEGDTIVVDVKNDMEGLETAIHWHGILHRRSQYMDGVPLVTQCPIVAGSIFRYKFPAEDPGTHFWHSHAGLQKMDGLVGSLIIRQTKSRDPHSSIYDHDLPSHVIMLQDWMHSIADEKLPGLRTRIVGQAPESIIVNGRGRYTNKKGEFIGDVPFAEFRVFTGARHRFRLINGGCTVCPIEVSFERHRLLAIASDSEPFQPVQVDSVVLLAGERYDVILKADQPPSAYWIHFRGLGECEELRIHQVAILRYEGSNDMKPSTPPPPFDDFHRGVVLNALGGECSPGDDVICASELRSLRQLTEYDMKLTPDYTFFLPFGFYVPSHQEMYLSNNYFHHIERPNLHLISLINNISMQYPHSPLISQPLNVPREKICHGSCRPKNCTRDFCTCFHMIRIPLGATIEVVLVDEFRRARLNHPFHIHGYRYHVVGMGKLDKETPMTRYLARDMNDLGQMERNLMYPIKKDTTGVPSNGYLIFRMKADNPGYWLFHCHFIYHLATGMSLVFHVGKNSDLPPVPPGFPQCGNWLPPI